MSKYSKKNKSTEKIKKDAMAIARGTQKPGQTKEQTKLIAQGIQKGIEIYKNQHNKKSRELDRKLNKLADAPELPQSTVSCASSGEIVKQSKLAWVLLAMSWTGFLIYIFN